MLGREWACCHYPRNKQDREIGFIGAANAHSHGCHVNPAAKANPEKEKKGSPFTWKRLPGCSDSYAPGLHAVAKNWCPWPVNPYSNCNKKHLKPIKYTQRGFMRGQCVVTDINKSCNCMMYKICMRFYQPLDTSIWNLMFILNKLASAVTAAPTSLPAACVGSIIHHLPS